MEKRGSRRDHGRVEGTMMEKGVTMVDNGVPGGTMMEKRGP